VVGKGDIVAGLIFRTGLPRLEGRMKKESRPDPRKSRAQFPGRRGRPRNFRRESPALLRGRGENKAKGRKGEVKGVDECVPRLRGGCPVAPEGGNQGQAKSVMRRPAGEKKPVVLRESDGISKKEWSWRNPKSKNG